MSVLTLAPETFNYLREGIEYAAYRTQVDINYNYAISSYLRDKDIEKESLRLVSSWADMNMKSYCIKYKDNDFIKISDFFRNYPNKEKINPYQFLKYLECLHYNIETEHWVISDQENKDYDLLKKIIESSQSAIINSLPQYQNSKWAA